MKVLFIGKRFYTNRDALLERYGRIYQLPWHWSGASVTVNLWLVDYHSGKTLTRRDGDLEIVSTPVRNLSLFGRWLGQLRPGSPRYDVVVASGDCYIGLMAWQVARRLGARFVFDVYDKYDEFRGHLRLPGVDLFRFLIKRADTLLFASNALMLELSANDGRAVLVPNGVDGERFVPRDMHESRELLGLPADCLAVGYFGGMEPDRGVSDLIEAVRKLREEGMRIELFLGGKPPPGLDLDRPGVRYLGNVPFERMPIALASCDLLAVPYRRSPFMDAGASNKIAESIASGRPFVATRTPNFLANFPEQASQLSELLAMPGDPDDIARVIREQAVRRVRVDMPDGMSWQDIAAATGQKLGLFNGAPWPEGVKLA